MKVKLVGIPYSAGLEKFFYVAAGLVRVPASVLCCGGSCASLGERVTRRLLFSSPVARTFLSGCL